ncbi:MAG: sn-glycerol-3-phosphate ABC transporter ATP-binding protein UgpC [Candidatus Hadarchaeales archaeon]
MVKVVLKNITKKFGDTVAVNNVSLEVRDKELAVFVGPSGCGKTTTLRIIAGLETPDSGDIYFGKQRVNDLSIKDRKIAMVFQDYALYPHMTVYDNMAFGLRNMGYKEPEIARRIKKAAELLEIEKLLGRRPAALSGGQRQRVALGRAIVREPSVFLWDEPLSNIDAKMRVVMRAELKNLQRELKTTTIHVTHDQLEAMTMGDKVVVMHAGSVKQVGPPEEIYSHPVDTFVAGFVGTPPINFIKCSVKERAGKIFLDAGEFTVGLDRKQGRLVKSCATGSEVIIGVRPEDVKIDGIRGAGISAKVELVELVGADNYVHLKAGKGKIIAKTPPNIRPAVGKAVMVRFDPDKIHVFDGKTEKAIF